MSSKNNKPSRTLGSRAAWLVTTLQEQGRPFFRLEDIRKINGISDPSAWGPSWDVWDSCWKLIS